MTIVRKLTSFCTPRHLGLLILLPLIFAALSVGYHKANPPPDIWIGTAQIRIPDEFREVFVRQISESNHREAILAAAAESRKISGRAAALFSRSFAAKPIPSTTLVEITINGYDKDDVEVLIEAAITHLLAFQQALGADRVDAVKQRLRDLDLLILDVEKQRADLGKLRANGSSPSAIGVLSTVMDTQFGLQLGELKLKREETKYESDTLTSHRLGKAMVRKQDIPSRTVDSAITAGLMGLAVALGIIVAVRRRKQP